MTRFALGALLLLGAWAGSAAADEAKTPVSASMLLKILAPAVEPRQTAFDEALKEPGPARRAFGEGEVLPDGSVRYGSVTVTVRNPCPPGSGHYEPPPLPGRRARN
jgi:hypothetical protein